MVTRRTKWKATFRFALVMSVGRIQILQVVHVGMCPMCAAMLGLYKTYRGSWNTDLMKNVKNILVVPRALTK